MELSIAIISFNLLVLDYNIVKDVSGDALIHETVTKVRHGSIVYTDKWRGYGSKSKQGKVCINGVEGFFSFAKER
jgi:transposase